MLLDDGDGFLFQYLHVDLLGIAFHFPDNQILVNIIYGN
jgi:hypothetical protein